MYVVPHCSQSARNQLAISYPVSTGSVFGPVESSGHLRVIFGSYSGFLGRVIPLTKKPEDSGYEIGCARIGEITVPMDKGNAGSGEENDSKCRQDPSGRPARVVKRWGGGGCLHHPFRGHIEWKFISHFTKNNLANEVHYESQFKSERVYFTRKKRLKAQIPFTTHWHFAMFALINCSSWIKLSVDETKMTRLWARIGSVLEFISFMIKKIIL